MKADISPSNPRVQHPMRKVYVTAATSGAVIAVLASPVPALAMHAR